jgi:hypothetical protein
MAWLYAVAFIAWLAVSLYTAPAVVSLYRRQGRYGDPARLNVFLIAVLFMGFLGRRLAAGEHQADAAMIALLTASTVVAGFTVLIARTYGRGRHV